MQASLLIVNYRSAELVLATLGHLESLADAPAAQTIVVDNSADEELGARLGPDVEHIVADRNRGFAGGVNLGLERATQEVVILLNPDARPEPGCLPALVAALRESPRVGIAAPALVPYSAAGAAVPSATRRDPFLLALLAEYTSLRRLLPPDWLDRHYFLRPEALSGPSPAAMVQGACFAFRRELVDRIGLFDEERFFLYWEETDYCRRARAAGWQVLYCPQVRCRHAGGGSTPDLELARRHFWWGLLAYCRKHDGLARALLVRSALLAGTASEVALLAALGLGRREDETLRSDLAENRRRIAHLLNLRAPERPA